MSPDDVTPDEEPQELPTGSAPQEGETEPAAGETVVPEADAEAVVTGSAPQEGEADEAPAETEAAEKAPAKRTRKAKVVAQTADEAPAPVAEKAPRRSRAKKADAVAETPAPAPSRSRSTERRAVVRAQAKYVRTSARKARMVCGHIRGKSVDEARAILAFTPRDVARDWSKLLESAVANAENNHELVGDDLIVHEAYADEGPTIKRFRPRAMGRATPIRKRTSHLTITLTPRS